MGTQDTRTFYSNYFLTREEVDQFKDEVRRGAHNTVVSFV